VLLLTRLLNNIKYTNLIVFGGAECSPQKATRNEGSSASTIVQLETDDDASETLEQYANKVQGAITKLK